MIFTILLWMGMPCPMPESCAAVAEFNQTIAQSLTLNASDTPVVDCWPNEDKYTYCYDESGRHVTCWPSIEGLMCEDDSGAVFKPGVGGVPPQDCKQFPSVEWQATGDSTTALRTAEHVFEIRTQRDPNCIDNVIHQCDAACKFTHKEGSIAHTEEVVSCHLCEDSLTMPLAMCQQAGTRELWLDGKRLGTLKYTNK